MQSPNYVIVGSNAAAFSINKVLRNTYLLLSATLFFSAITAIWGVRNNVHPGMFITIIGVFGLLFLTQALRNSKWGLAATFAFTGFMGYTLAPILNLYMHTFANGGALIATALGGTAAIFLSLSGYVLITRKSFTYLGGLLFAAITVAFLLSLATLFFHTPIMQAGISAAFILICSGLILFHTSQIIEGGERNYISATISLYVALFNLFVSLLNILGFFAGSNRQ